MPPQARQAVPGGAAMKTAAALLLWLAATAGALSIFFLHLYGA